MNEALTITSKSIPGQQALYDGVFPFVWHCESPQASLKDLTEWIGSRRDELTRQSAESGAVLFRGFPLSTAEDLDKFIAAFDYVNFRYKDSLSNAIRVNRTERVFTANEAPPEAEINLHHEMAQTPIYPSRLFFFCEAAPDEGGATPLVRSDRLWERITSERPDFARDCEAKGLQYSHVMPAESDLKSSMGRTWQSTFGAENRDQAEKRLARLEYTWQWHEDGSLQVTTPVLPAVRNLGSGRKSFFNQLLAAFLGWKDSRNRPEDAIRFGDGSRLDRDAVMHAAQIADELTFEMNWQLGDAVLLDNYVVMHGRRPFRGTRKVLASLVAAED
jgi:alpha-ketoglutarate-dependent taurine dioxygenase